SQCAGAIWTALDRPDCPARPSTAPRPPGPSGPAVRRTAPDTGDGQASPPVLVERIRADPAAAGLLDILPAWEPRGFPPGARGYGSTRRRCSIYGQLDATSGRASCDSATTPTRRSSVAACRPSGVSTQHS